MSQINSLRKKIIGFNLEYNDTLNNKQLKNQAVKGGALSFIAQFVSFVLQMSTTFILARLLTPNDYGMVAMVTALTGFMHIFRDLGLSTATVQKKNLSLSDVSSLFWLNVLLGTTLFVVVILISSQISIFYSEPKLFNISIIISIGFVISSLGSQHQALLQRAMRFKILTTAQVISNLISSVAGIMIAINGYGYWALIFMQLISPLVYTIFCWINVKWRPSFKINISKSKHLIRFGSYITGFDIVNYFARNLDNILIGRFINAASVGLYSKAYQILMLPINQLRGPLGQVSMPALSTLQNDPLQFKKFYLRFINILSFLSIPVVLFMLLNSQNIIPLLLGNQWSESIPLFKILAFTAVIQPILGTLGILLMALGRSKIYFIWGIVNSTIIVISLLVGVYYGLTALAWSYTIANYLLFFPSLWICLANTTIRIKDFLRALIFPLFSAILATIILFIIFPTLIYSQLISILISFVVFSTLYIIIYNIFPQGRYEFKQHLSIITEIKNNNGK